MGNPLPPGGGMLAPPADVGVMGGGKGGMEKPDPGRIGAIINASDHRTFIQIDTSEWREEKSLRGTGMPPGKEAPGGGTPRPPGGGTGKPGGGMPPGNGNGGIPATGGGGNAP